MVVFGLLTKTNDDDVIKTVRDHFALWLASGYESSYTLDSIYDYIRKYNLKYFQKSIGNQPDSNQKNTEEIISGVSESDKNNEEGKSKVQSNNQSNSSSADGDDSNIIDIAENKVNALIEGIKDGFQSVKQTFETEVSDQESNDEETCISSKTEEQNNTNLTNSTSDNNLTSTNMPNDQNVPTAKQPKNSITKSTTDNSVSTACSTTSKISKTATQADKSSFFYPEFLEMNAKTMFWSISITVLIGYALTR